MPKFINNDDRYGMSGPFEAESREALADEMMATFEEWAMQALVDAGYDYSLCPDTFKEDCIVQMREEFINALEEVE